MQPKRCDQTPDTDVTWVVCAVIFDGAGRVLIAKRPAGRRLGGYWEFPGGKQEPGETVEAALRRELHEELGIATEVTEVLDPVDHHDGQTSIRLIPCRTTILSGIPVPLEHDGLAWVHPCEVDLSTFAPADIPILSRLMDH